MLAGVGRVLMGLVTALLTEVFLKKAIILILEKLVAKTQTDIDDELLKAAKKAWDMEEK